MRFISLIFLFLFLPSTQGISQTILSQHINSDPNSSGGHGCIGGIFTVFREYVLVDEGVNFEAVTILGAQVGLKGNTPVLPQNLKVDLYALSDPFPNSFPGSATLLGTYEGTVSPADNQITIFDINLSEPQTVPLTATILIAATLEASTPTNYMALEDTETKISWYSSQCGNHQYVENPHPGLILNLVIEETLGIYEPLLQNIVISPNPTSSMVTIEKDPSFTIESIAVYNALGKKLRMEPFRKTLDLSPLSNGLYLLHLSTPQGTVVKKLIKI